MFYSQTDIKLFQLKLRILSLCLCVFVSKVQPILSVKAAHKAAAIVSFQVTTKLTRKYKWRGVVYFHYIS